MNAETSYDPFAWLYARFWGIEFHRYIVDVLRRLVLNKLPEGASILDLCCGDGRLTRRLHKLGYAVRGIDGSAEMLSYARQYAADIDYGQADARNFILDEPVDAVLSTFDSLNHVLATDDLALVFACVHRALKPGGWFAFDLNEEPAYRDLWIETTALVLEDVVSVALSGFDAESGMARCNITQFRRDSGCWERSDFTLLQKHHPADEVIHHLETSGFERIGTHPAANLGMYGTIGQHRLFYLARKPEAIAS